LRKEDFEFIGVKSYKDNQEREKILNSYDKYQLKKLEFLNLYYDNQSTMLSYFGNYNNNIHDYEVAKNKDLMRFTPDEAESAIRSCVWTMDNTQKNLFVFGKKYCSWCKNVLKLVDINPFDLLVMRTVTKDSKAKLQRKLIPLKIFYKQCYQMLKEEVPIDHIMVVICIRYGISGDKLLHIRNLKWSDIDYDNKMVLIENEKGNIVTRIPVDNEFLYWLNQLEHLPTDIYVFGSKTGYGKPLEYTSIYTRIRKCYDKIEAVQQGIKDPLFNRQLEIVLLLRQKRQLYDYDIVNVLEKFAGKKIANDKRSQMYSFIDKYEILTEDKVLRTSRAGTYNKMNLTNPEDIIKEPAEKVVNRILKELRLELVEELDIDQFINEKILVDDDSDNINDNKIQKINGLKVDSDGVILEEACISIDDSEKELENN
jgi:integrase